MKNTDFLSMCYAVSVLYNQLAEEGLCGIGTGANRIQLLPEKYAELFGNTELHEHSADHFQMRVIENGITYFTLVRKGVI